VLSPKFVDVVKEIGNRWWTSGAHEGCPGKLGWCGSGEWYSEAELGPMPDITDAKKCVVLVKTSSGLSLTGASCEERNRPLCEVFPNPTENINFENSN